MEHPEFKRLLSKTNTRDAVEHRHRDGLIRGVMAGMLNRAYGIVERLYGNETADVLRALALFHDTHPATAALGEPRYGIIGKAMNKKVMKYGAPPSRHANRPDSKKECQTRGANAEP
jgi:hypothetical protein